MTFFADITLTESHPELIPIIRERLDLADLSLRFGTNRPGAQNHQEGVTVPKREFLSHQPEDIEDYKTTLSDWILERGPFAGSVRSELDAALFTIMTRSAMLNFDSQGRPDSWEDLSEKTIERRRNQNKFSILILQDTGLLRASLSSIAGGNGAIREVVS